jgi:quinol monooxygenase YgiN
MPVLVIACFKPKPGKADKLLEVLRDHQPVLRSQGLVTDRAAIVMRAADGTIIEVFEWKSQAAIEAAHSNPEVHKLWARFEAVCEYVPVNSLPEAAQMFPGFVPVMV